VLSAIYTFEPESVLYALDPLTDYPMRPC